MSLTLDKILSMIPERAMGHFATVNGDKPEVRGWQLQFIEDGKFYFCTSTKKEVYEQMKKNPNVSFIVEASGYIFRISGVAEFDDSNKTRDYTYSRIQEGLKTLYPTVESNGFTAFTISHGVIRYAQGFGPFASVTF